jgi:hypothetical protein
MGLGPFGDMQSAGPERPSSGSAASVLVGRDHEVSIAQLRNRQAVAAY